MPNWCNNEVNVTGEEKDLEQFKTFVRNDEPYHGNCSDVGHSVMNSETGKWEWVEYETYCKEDDPIYKDTCDKRYQEFSFEQIIPMPKEFLHTTSPMDIFETQEDLDTHLEELKSRDGYDISNGYYKNIIAKAVTREYSDNLKNIYGVDNWYDWCNKTWGTKWDTSDSNLEDFGFRLQYDFETAWSPPENICYTLRDMFPDLTISWFFREEGVEMAGYL